MGTRGLSGGKADGEKLQREIKNRGQVKTQKGRRLKWRAGTGKETGRG